MDEGAHGSPDAGGQGEAVAQIHQNDVYYHREDEYQRGSAKKEKQIIHMHARQLLNGNQLSGSITVRDHRCQSKTNKTHKFHKLLQFPVNVHCYFLPLKLYFNQGEAPSMK